MESPSFPISPLITKRGIRIGPPAVHTLAIGGPQVARNGRSINTMTLPKCVLHYGACYPRPSHPCFFKMDETERRGRRGFFEGSFIKKDNEEKREKRGNCS